MGGSKPKTVLYFSYSITVLYENGYRTGNVIKRVLKQKEGAKVVLFISTDGDSSKTEGKDV